MLICSFLLVHLLAIKRKTSLIGAKHQTGYNKSNTYHRWDICQVIESEDRWQDLEGIRRRFPDKFLVGYGMCIYDRAHYLRGLENLWTDIYLNTHELERLLDILVELNLKAIKMYSRLQYDGYYFWDDWGLQDRLMISPDKWREIWKPRFSVIFEAVHKAGMYSFMHCCGYIVDILDDLIDSGLDVIQMDQQENMGLETLGQRFSGKITFFSPVDIQTVMNTASQQQIRQYCHKMVEHLGSIKGGFIAKYYIDSKSAGHSQKALKAMCQEFLKIADWQ